MASTKSLSFFTPLLSLSPKTPSLFLFPKLPLKTPRNPLPVISCSSPKITEQRVLQSNEKTLHPLPRATAYNYEDNDDTAAEADGGEAADDDDDNDNIGSGISAVPKKRTSRSKTKIRKNVWKRKAYFSALKAYSLAKSISTGKSKSFLILDKK